VKHLKQAIIFEDMCNSKKCFK